MFDCDLRSTKGKGFMTKEMLTKFLNEKQRDSRLNEELFPLVRTEQVKNLIEKYEPSSSNASRGEFCLMIHFLQ